MRKFNYVVAAAVVAGAVSMGPTLRAQIKDDPHSKGMMDMGPDMRKRMGGMMEECNQMMQGSPARPNEQWRKDGAHGPNDRSDSKQ